MSEKQQLVKIDKSELFDGSSLDLHGLCPRKYYYQYELDLVPLKEAKALTFGSAIHEFMFHYYSGDKEDDCLEAFVKICQRDRSQIKTFMDEGDPADRYSIEFGLHTLKRYIKRFKNEHYRPLEDEHGEPYLEVGFAIDVGSGVFWGKFDGLFIDTLTKQIFIMEHKHTTHQINDRFWLRYILSNQVTNYMWAVTQVRGEMPTGCIINAVRVYPYKRGAEEEIIQKSFARTVAFRSPEKVQARGAELQWLIAYIRKCREFGIDAFSPTTSSCFAYNRQCEYMELCMSNDQKIFNTFAQYGFAKRTWQPYDPEEEMKKLAESGRRIVAVEAQSLLES